MNIKWPEHTERSGKTGGTAIMKISVIIPTYNEADFISETIRQVWDRGKKRIEEIIVTDGGSSDQTLHKAEASEARVLQCPRKGRAAQMNYGARLAKGDILYFLHADTLPPHGYDTTITEATLKGHQAGCFQLSFDASHKMLQLYARFTRFNIDAFRFGDQSLFIKRDIFSALQGFREDHLVMEDQEIVRRIKYAYSFTILEDCVITSARKYRENGVVRLQLIFTLIFLLYYLGVSQKKLIRLYGNLTRAT